jgi:hypothetical protein
VAPLALGLAEDVFQLRPAKREWTDPESTTVLGNRPQAHWISQLKTEREGRER